jgi:hypothetical protein
MDSISGNLGYGMEVKEQGLCHTKKGVAAREASLFLPPYQLQYRRQLSRIDSMVNPPESSHLGHDLINQKRIERFRKQL